MATKQLETLSGPVEQVNAKQTGIKLLGEWLNVSQYHPIVPMPTPGELVQVQIERTDKGAWINSLQIVGAAAATSSPSTRDRTFTRRAVLEAASNFLGLMSQAREEIRSDHVLILADKWLAWVEQEGEDEAF